MIPTGPESGQNLLIVQLFLSAPYVTRQINNWLCFVWLTLLHTSKEKLLIINCFPSPIVLLATSVICSGWYASIAERAAGRLLMVLCGTYSATNKPPTLLIDWKPKLWQQLKKQHSVNPHQSWFHKTCHIWLKF